VGHIKDERFNLAFE